MKYFLREKILQNKISISVKSIIPLKIEPHISECHGENKPVIFLSVKDKRKGKKSSKETRPKINVTNYNENEHECDICEEILTSKWSLQNHKLKKHHDILGIGYKCDKCDYTAKDAKRLKEHESSKHNPKYRCDQCDFVGMCSRKISIVI